MTSEKTPQLKGKHAEHAVLAYLKKTNRPYGSSDISANMRNTVSKAAAQKILVALADKQLVTQKTYGKATYFVAPQSPDDDLASHDLDALSGDVDRVTADLKERAVECKRIAAELAKVKATPTDSDLDSALADTTHKIELLQRTLQPLRAGQAPISESDLAQLDADWLRWRTEWARRRKVWKALWDIFADSLSPVEAANLLDDLGIEQDSPEHQDLEKSDLCKPKK
ncbi:Tat-binding protein 1(TBP-1)-interacting protein [Ceratobasidium theobromae]|uniref:Tat-binding protein 1(TBP-1)-interacting protein n=1 Tax=Ceratobasidium theobromae TaxID=1582974 RepID=A0A5N5QQT2_9AGAM|nr:Tat-binding protein 1(TBP-1)-interacting protein [Ceratobasidium theobromae]